MSFAPLSLASLLLDAARLCPSDEAVFDGRRRLDFAALLARAQALAYGLGARGIGRGARVAIVSANSVEYVEAYAALALLGAVGVPVNWRLRAGEVRHVLCDAEVSGVIVEQRFTALVDEALADATLCGVRLCVGPAPAGWTPFEECVEEHAAPLAPAPVAPTELAILMYTSGTTGPPRGAMLTHGNVLSLVERWVEELDLRGAPDRFLQVTPLFHVGGMLQLMSTLRRGAALRLLPEFLPGPALDVLEGEAATHALFVPSMLQWLLAEKGLEARRFRALRCIVYGAAPIDPRSLARALEVFRCGFLQGYGLTETAGVVTTLRPKDHDPHGAPARLASAGRALAGCELRTVDERMHDVPRGEPGEVIVRGPQVVPGYWRRPDDTASSFVDGWFRTGDVGRLDADGYLTLVDRVKDLILVAGENVFPGEVEAALREHPDVAAAAVIGIPHAHWGEEVLAVVVPRSGAQPDERVLVQHCRARLARFKCPTKVELRAELPRNPAGKVLKRELREAWWRGRERRI